METPASGTTAAGPRFFAASPAVGQPFAASLINNPDVIALFGSDIVCLIFFDRRGPLLPAWLTALRSLSAARSVPFAHVVDVRAQVLLTPLGKFPESAWRWQP